MLNSFSDATRPRTQPLSSYLFIFDLDGTLLDTEYEISGLTARLANESGLKITQDKVFQLLSGKSAAEKFESIALINGKTLKPAKLKALCAAHSAGKEALLSRPDLPLVYGALDLLKTLKREGHILATATNNPQDRAILALKNTRLLDFFEDRVYTPDSVGGLAKPDPAMLLAALADTKTDSGRAIVVEDSLTGVAAAKAAKIVCFGYADPRFGPRIDRQRRALEQAGAALTVEMLIDMHSLLLARTLPSRMPKWGFTPD